MSCQDYSHLDGLMMFSRQRQEGVRVRSNAYVIGNVCSFAGNKNLCGKILNKKCPGEAPFPIPSPFGAPASSPKMAPTPTPYGAPVPSPSSHL